MWNNGQDMNDIIKVSHCHYCTWQFQHILCIILFFPPFFFYQALPIDKVYFMFDLDLILQYLNCVRNFVSFTFIPWHTNQEKTEILTYMKHMLWNKNLLILTGKLRSFVFSKKQIFPVMHNLGFFLLIRDNNNFISDLKMRWKEDPQSQVL